MRKHRPERIECTCQSKSAEMNDDFLIDFDWSQREDQLLQDFSRVDNSRMSIAHKSPGLYPSHGMGHLSDLQFFDHSVVMLSKNSDAVVLNGP